MPIFEFECPQCGLRIERYTVGDIDKPAPLCTCGVQTEQIEWSIPAKRNPERGIQN